MTSARSGNSWRGTLLAALVLASITAGCADSGQRETAELTAAAPSEAGGLVSVNGTELFVRRVGAGDPVLVVHGGPLLDHGYLVPWLEPLADEFELIFYDQRLSGRSAANVDPDSIRLATFVDDIEALRNELRLGDVHVLAHSWGGLLAMRHAVRHRDAVRSLTLVSPIPASASDWQHEQRAQPPVDGTDLQAQMAALRDSPAFRAREPAAVREMLLLSFQPQFADRRHAGLLELYVPADYGARSTALGAMMGDLQEFDFYDELRSVDAPTLLVYGDQEAGSGIGGAAIAAAMPNARLHEIAQAGHFAFIEQPQDFLELLGGFLRRAR